MSFGNITGFRAQLKTIKSGAEKFRGLVHDALIHAAYFAFKDGNTTPFNDLIEAVGNGTHIKGITMWVELVAGIGRVRDEKIVLNKKVMTQSGVIDLATFEPFKQEMEKAPRWFEITGKQKPESVFDEGAYMKRVIKKLTEEGYADLADQLKQTELKWLVQKAAAAGENATAKA